MTYTGMQTWSVYVFAVAVWVVGESLQWLSGLPLYGDNPTDLEILVWVTFVMAMGAMEVAAYYGSRILDEVSDD